MKFGVRKPSIKRSIKARTTGRAKRAVKRSVNPLYGKKGMGLINNPKKSIYNKVYAKTTIDSLENFKKSTKKNKSYNHRAHTPSQKVNSDIKDDQLSGINTGLGCLSLIGILISFASPGLFIITIPLFVYAIYSSNKKTTQHKESNNNSSPTIQTQTIITSQTTSLAENENEINIVYSKPLDGLLIGEIILLDWLHEKELLSIPPQYFSYTYGINHNNAIKKLSKLGYIRYGTPSESLPNLKVIDLKQILSHHDLKSSGRKAELINRIQEELSEDDYNEDVSKVWIVTGTGKEILNKYDLLIWGHKNGSNDSVVTPASLLNYLSDSRPYEKIALELSEFDFRKNIQNINYGLAINNLQYQITLLEKMELYDEVLDLLLGSIVLELTGIGNSGSDYIYFYKGSIYTDNLKAQMIKYQDLLKLNTEGIVEKANRVYDIYNPQLTDVKLYKNKKEFLIGLNTLINGTKTDMDDLVDAWYARIPKKHIL